MRAAVAAILLILATLAGSGAPALAQMTTDDLIDPGPADPAVEKALGWERLQTKVRYLRSETEFRPGEDIKVVIPPKPETRNTSDDRMTTGLIVFLIVAVVIVVFVIFGSNINVSFGKTSEAKRRSTRRRTGVLGGGLTEIPRGSLLDHLAAMPDKRRALILLTGHALERAASLNDLKLARAQTARDVLRILPRQWRHLGAMRTLVREAEIVHFGGRDLADETWQACLDAARPLFDGQEAAA